MTILLSENFDDVAGNASTDLTSRGWDIDSSQNGRWACVGVAGANGSAQSFRNELLSADQSPAFPEKALSAAVSTGQSIYMVVWMKFEEKDGGDYTFYNDGGNEQKLFYCRAWDGGSAFSGAMAWRNEISCLSNGGDNKSGILRLDFNIHDDHYLQNVGSAFLLQSHTWYIFQCYFKISGNNTADGEAKFWVTDTSGTYNGGAETLIMDYTGVNMRTPTNPDPTENNVTTFWISSNWGGLGNPTHEDQYIYYDEIEVNTEKVDTGGGGGYSKQGFIRNGGSFVKVGQQ